MGFADAASLTYDGTSYADALFVEDGIHLNHQGQLLWRDGHIWPQLEALIRQTGWDHLRRTVATA